MTHRRIALTAIGAAAFVLAGAGCSADTTSPSATASAPSPPSLTASASPAAPSSTPSPTATPTLAPLVCPEALTVAAATESALRERTTNSPTACAYSVPDGSTSGSIQSEEWFGGRTLKAYRRALTLPRNQIKGIKTKVVDRPDFGPGAFMVTITGGSAGAISSLVVPRPGGHFASISASRVKADEFFSDVKLTEGLARAFLDNHVP